jgi:hypothetical protein
MLGSPCNRRVAGCNCGKVYRACQHGPCGSSSVVQVTVSGNVKGRMTTHLRHLHDPSACNATRTPLTCAKANLYPEANKYSTCSGAEGKQLEICFGCQSYTPCFKHTDPQQPEANTSSSDACCIAVGRRHTTVASGLLVLMIHVNNHQEQEAQLPAWSNDSACLPSGRQALSERGQNCRHNAAECV